MIYLFDKMDSFSDALLERNLRVVSRERAEKAKQFRDVRDQKLSVLAYLLLAYGLRKEYGIVEELQFAYGKNGKPYLRNYPAIFFNVSHCRRGVVCVVADAEVGIDIEEVTDYDQDTIDYVCSESEERQIRRAQNPALEFCKLWTLKESVLKYTGQGLADNLKTLLPDERVRLTTSVAPDGSYVISLCERRCDR
ncbi:4'-phosphopantetheinyl transferase family protein [Azotosporobacter soli]|uniref:4'-phosphopantetheinyl transferase family protein n=1 Tax=Azotosporobacter soli TaxID=3055040 RepID=UPI0031FEC7BE